MKLGNGKTKLESNYKDPAKYAASRKKESTRKLYAVALRAFAKHVNIPYEKLHTYLKKPKLDDITSFAVDKSAGTRKGYVSVVRSWLEHNDVELSKQQQEEIRVTIKKGDKTREEPLTIDIIRDMCDHVNLQGKTLFITLLASGCRIEELLLTERDDVDLEKGTIQIRGDIAKTGNGRLVVISLEAVKFLNEWVAQREAYIISSHKRGQFVRNPVIRGVGKNKREIKREDLLFPYSYETARSLFSTAIRKVFKIKAAPDPKHPKANLRRNWGDLYDPKTGRGRLHIHSFRGAFRMQLRKGADPDICEILMGHATALGGAYRDITEEQLIQEYRKAEEHLTVYPPTDELRKKIRELSDSDAKRDAELETLRKELSDARTEFKNTYEQFMQMKQSDNLLIQYLSSAHHEPFAPLRLDPDIEKETIEKIKKAAKK